MDKAKKEGAPFGNQNAAKPPGTGRVQVQLSLPAELAAKLQKHGGKSKLIQRLLWAYFEANPAGGPDAG